MDDAHRREFHTMMADELRRLDHLISQLLEVGRLDAVGTKDRPENVPLLPLLTRCAEMACLHHQCEFDRVFTMDVPPVTLCSRRIVLQLVFSNLLDNAVKYSADPRRVQVVAERVEKDRLRVRITDNGSGVEWQDRKKIFRIFYRGGSELQRRHKGTGLGLYIVYTLVRRLKGRVSVVPRPDGQPGSTFEVELPGLVDDAVSSATSTTSEDRALPRSREAEAVT